jgi:hypothetical protein
VKPVVQPLMYPGLLKAGPTIRAPPKCGAVVAVACGQGEPAYVLHVVRKSGRDAGKEGRRSIAV